MIAPPNTRRLTLTRPLDLRLTLALALKIHQMRGI